MKCAACHAEMPSGLRFCEECGSPLERRCPQCGATPGPAAKFCGSCGCRLATLPEGAADLPNSRITNALDTPPNQSAAGVAQGASGHAEGEVEGERRQVTVLFADIAGFTAMAEKLDPEEVHRITERCFELVTVEIHRFGGSVNQYGGDGVMALFGAPIALENAPQRAVHAALGIQRALRDHADEMQRAHGVSLKMRIGLNTGLVVVGRIGAERPMEYTAIGDTINLASRLQTTARPGSVVVSETTYKATVGFLEVQDLGELQLKGHAPVRAFEIIRARSQRTRIDVEAERGLTPLVGREQEIAALQNLFAQAKSGRGQVVFVTGEAGIGKSRLVLELKRRLAAASEDVNWIEGRCISFGQNIPLLPVIEQLRDAFGIDETDGDQQILARIADGPGRTEGLEWTAPFLRHLFAVGAAETEILSMDGPMRRRRLFEALRDISLRSALMRPTVSVIEDLHWMDASTSEYLDFLMDSVAGAPVMLILTHRLDYASAFGHRSFHTHLNLNSLSEAQALDMAQRMLSVEHLPRAFRAALAEKAEGVPLFVEEVIKTVVDIGVLKRANDSGYEIAGGADAVIIPGTVQDMIMARLDRLSEDARRVVQMASVIGRQFLVRLLERIARPERRLDDILRELKAQEIIYEKSLAAETICVFKHAIIQDVAYESLLLQHRRRLHLAVGGAIEELYSDRLSDHSAELAHHFTCSEEWRKAMTYSTLAADTAFDSFANREAAQHYALALGAADHLRDAGAATIVRLCSRRGAVLNVLGKYEDAEIEYRRGIEAARVARDRLSEGELLTGLGELYYAWHRLEQSIASSGEALAVGRLIGAPEIESQAMGARALSSAALYGPTDEIAAQASEAARLSENIPSPKIAARSLLANGMVLQWRAEFDSAADHLERTIALAERSHAGLVFGQAVFGLGHVHLSRGDYGLALENYRRLSEYANNSGDKFSMVRVPNCIAAVHLELYDLEEALRMNVEGEEIAHRLFTWPEPRAHSLLKAGLACLEMSELGKAGEFFERTLALYKDDTFARWRWYVPLLNAMGWLALARKQAEEALTFGEKSLMLALETRAQKHVARAYRLRGAALLAAGKIEDSGAELKKSLDISENLKLLREVWLGYSTLARVQMQLGADGEAERSLLKSASTIEVIAGRTDLERLRTTFLESHPVGEVYRLLGRKPPTPNRS